MALPWSSEQRNITTPVTSDVGVSLAEFNGRLYATWKRGDDDNKVWCSSFDGHAWSLQMSVSRIETSAGTSLVYFQGALYAADKGPNHKDILYWTRFDGKSWENDKRMGDYNSTHGPTLVTFRGNLLMLCRLGKHDTIWYGLFDGTSWKRAVQTPFATSARLGAAVIGKGDRQVLVAVWRGVDADERLYYSIFDGSNWTRIQPVPGPTETTSAPALVTFRGRIYVAWRGNDQSIRYMSFDGHIWSPQYRLQGPKAGNCGPSLAVFRNQLVAAWIGEDLSIWWTQTGIRDSRDVHTMVQDMTLNVAPTPEPSHVPLTRERLALETIQRPVSGPPLTHVSSAPAAVASSRDYHHMEPHSRGPPPGNPVYYGPPSATNLGPPPMHPTYAAPHAQARQVPHTSHQVMHANAPPAGAHQRVQTRKESFVSELEHVAIQEAKRDVKSEVKRGIRTGISNISGSLFSSFGGSS